MSAATSGARRRLARPIDPAGRARTTDHAGDNLSGVEQGLTSQVGVTLGHAGLGVPKQALDHVKRHTLVHQEAGERMAQIMQSDVSRARTALDAVPWTEQTRELRWEDVGARRIVRRRLSAVRWPQH